MDIDKVRALTDAELGGELVTQRRHLYDLRFQLATRQLTDHSQLTSSRRTIARLLTVMTERGIDERLVSRAAPEPRKPATRKPVARKPAARSRASSKEAAPKAATGGNE